MGSICYTLWVMDLRKKKIRKVYGCQGIVWETLLNWISVSTNHPLMNSVTTAFIALRTGEKCVHVGFAVTRMLNGKDTAEGWNTLCFLGGSRASISLSLCGALL